MNNIRIKINLSKIQGSKVVNMKSESGKMETYVAIPTRALFVPAENPAPYLLGTMILTPNSQWNDFMIKPYMAAEDYKLLSEAQKKEIPTIGSGSFMQSNNQTQIGRGAETIDYQPAELSTNLSTQPTNAPAATQPQSSFPGEAGTLESCLNIDKFFVLDCNEWKGEFESFTDAVMYAEKDQVNRPIIECWAGNTKRGRWKYDPTHFSWNQVK